VPTSGEGNRLSQLRMANDIQCMLHDNNVTQFAVKRHRMNSAFLFKRNGAESTRLSCLGTAVDSLTSATVLSRSGKLSANSASQGDYIAENR